MSDTIIESVVETVVELVDESISLLTEGVQGPPGPRGEKGDRGDGIIHRTAATTLSGHRAVIVEDGGAVAYASNANQTHASRVIGITTGATSAGLQAAIQSFGELTEPSWNWNVSTPVYLGVDGFLTQDQPQSPAAVFSVVMGFPTSPTTLFVNVREPLLLA